MRRITLIFRPLERPWENPTPDDERQYPRFDTPYSETKELLEREAEMLGASEVIIQLDAKESQIRNDGFLRADTKIDFPGVRVNLETRHGPLTYATDKFRRASGWSYKKGSTRAAPGWQMNLRAIALGLEALRKVDRYGIASAGEQYRGWNELPSGVPMGPAMTLEQAAILLADASYFEGPIIGHPDNIKIAYKMASKMHHPDAGGDPEMFHKIKQARDLLMKEMA